MPQDIQAPKGRLIFTQVQVMRELLDKGCQIMAVTTEQLKSALQKLNQALILLLQIHKYLNMFMKIFLRKQIDIIFCFNGRL